MRYFLAPLILVGWPLAEIAGFVIVGKAIGLWATLGLVIGTAVLGAMLLRSKSMAILRQITTEGREGRMPGRALVDSGMIILAGILLLLPGFLTDLLGLALFIPYVRNFIWSQIGRRIVVVRSRSGARYQYGNEKPATGGATSGPVNPAGPVVDLDEQDFHRNPSASNPSSPWAGPKGSEP